MTFVARRILGTQGPKRIVSGRSNYVTVGGLLDDGFLTREQAKLAASILTWTDDDRTPPEEGGLAKNVREFVEKFRIIVFAEVVKKKLNKFPGREATPVGIKGRRDLKVTSNTGDWIMVVPVLTLVEDSGLLSRLRDRLDGNDKANDRQLIVIPNGSAAGENEESPRVVYYDKMEATVREMLGEPKPEA